MDEVLPTKAQLAKCFAFTKHDPATIRRIKKSAFATVKKGGFPNQY